MAPELIRSDEYNKSIDIWSCGVIMYKLTHKDMHPILDDVDSMEIYQYQDFL